MMDDERRGVGEDDLTHADEVIELHDISRDPAAGDAGSLRARVLENPSHRAMHHHVFTTRSALHLLDHVDLDLVEVESRWPHDIYVLGRRPQRGDSVTRDRRLLSSEAAFLRNSPFRLDRREASAYR